MSPSQRVTRLLVYTIQPPEPFHKHNLETNLERKEFLAPFISMEDFQLLLNVAFSLKKWSQSPFLPALINS